MQAWESALDAEEADTARRTFQAAQPILRTADAMERPAATRARTLLALMGEIRDPRRAARESRKLLSEASSRERPARSAQLGASRLARRENKRTPWSVFAPARGGGRHEGPCSSRRVLLLTSDIAREAGDMGGARKPLADALKDLAKARAGRKRRTRARREAHLARPRSFRRGQERGESARARARGGAARPAPDAARSAIVRVARSCAGISPRHAMARVHRRGARREDSSIMPCGCASREADARAGEGPREKILNAGRGRSHAGAERSLHSARKMKPHDLSLLPRLHRRRSKHCSTPRWTARSRAIRKARTRRFVRS